MSTMAQLNVFKLHTYYAQGRLKHTMGPGQKKRMGPIIMLYHINMLILVITNIYR